MKRLLTHSPTQRLGSLKGGANDVKAHPWFAEFEWDAFENQTMLAPYIPKVRTGTCLQSMSRPFDALSSFTTGDNIFV